MSEIQHSVTLTDRGRAFYDFAFRDALALGLDKKDAYSIAQALIEEWDGTETLLQIYNRTRVWPDEVQ